MISPASRYTRSRADQDHPAFADFRALYDFDLDDFQVTAGGALEEGRGVLVAAPTGSGKTVVGEFAVHLALAQGRKCFYTTPIKALSNQKFHDLVRRYGSDQVGLLTGDNTINGEAPVVVMTTEVLRNMLYAGSRTLQGLGYVVMDEVHYLADRFRGAVWEEVIIHLPESVSLVSLSATVSNAEEFGKWLSEVRDVTSDASTLTVVEERRPVPLFQHVLVGRRMYDLFEDEDNGQVNRELERIAREGGRTAGPARDHRGGDGRPGRGGQRGRRGKQRRGRPHPQSRPRGRHHTPRRADVLDRLDAEGLLPAIVFIFSRAGCAAAVEQCLHSGLRLTTPEEEREIRSFVDSHCASIPDEDLDVLGYPDFLDALTRGVASHHAGLLPTFKECVEELFSRGLVKAVFATETLALGINMPARSVVLEKLSKWNGETHADVTPGEYTQLTGRAGRRGIDIEGHGIVLWQPGLDPRQVAGLASTRTYPLRSSFRPSYNMAVNLVGQVGRARARELLEQSFAQFQADRAVVGLSRQVHKAEEALQGYADAAQCDYGDFLDYARLRRRLSDQEARHAKSRKTAEREQVMSSLDLLRPGDVIRVPAGRWAGLAVVVDPGVRSDRSGPRPLVLTIDRHARRLSMNDFPTPVTALTRMRVPKSFNARSPQARRDLASALRSKSQSAELAEARGEHDNPGPSPTTSTTQEDAEAERIRAELRAHPCHECPNREDHARWAERYFKLDRETDHKRRRIDQRTNTVARQFDRICEVLDELSYLAGDTVTEAGQRLQRIYSELDLVTSECIRQDVWARLDPAELACVLSGLTHETRSVDDAPEPQFPGRAAAEAADAMTRLWSDLQRVEHAHNLDFLRRPDFGFAWAAWQWSQGAALDDVLGESGLAPGDFVRSVKQLLDLVDQVADAAGVGELRTNARAAHDLLLHGVVAYSSVSEP